MSLRLGGNPAHVTLEIGLRLGGSTTRLLMGGCYSAFFFVLTHSVILRIGSTVVDIRTQINTNNYYATPAASAELCALLSAVPAVFHGFGFATQ